MKISKVNEVNYNFYSITTKSQISFKSNPIFEQYAKIIKTGTLDEMKKIPWLHSRGTNADTLLHRAIIDKVPSEKVEYLSTIISPNAVNKDKLSAFNLAAKISTIDILKILSKQKIDINSQDCSGCTPLLNSLHSNSLDKFKYLLSINANPNIKGYDNFAPVHILYNDIDALKLLKQYNANLGLTDLNGRNISFYAAEEGRTDLLSQYVNFGIDLSQLDKNNQSSLFIAKDIDTLKFLKDQGVSLNTQDIIGDTILHKAYKKKDFDRINFLEANDIDTEIVNQKGLKAFEINNTNVIQTLGEHGFSKVAGMDDLKKTLCEMVIEPLTKKEEYKAYGLSVGNGILLHGMPGCGKTFIAEALAEETGRSFFKITPMDVSNKYFGEDALAIHNIFEQAKWHAPSLVFIDEMEAIAPSRASLAQDTSSQATSQDIIQRIDELLEQMNNSSQNNIFIVGATNNPNQIDNAIKRPGRIDKSIFIPPPDIKARAVLFQNELKKRPKSNLIKYFELAKQTENYTAKEIEQVVDKAAHIARQNKRNIEMEDLLKSIKVVRPKITKAGLKKYKQTNDVTDFNFQNDNSSRELDKLKGFDKIIGMDGLKKQLTQSIIEPMLNVAKRKKYGLKPLNGVLLYGPPGTGKTFISQALAEESERYFIEMNPSSILSSYHGQTALNINKIFEIAEYNAPSIIFIDEIEALAPIREQLGSNSIANDLNTQVSELLQQINNCSERDIFIIASTNNPQLIDSAIRRSGRLDKIIFVSPPDYESRKGLFNQYLQKTFCDINSINLEELASKTENYTAKEIEQLILEASMTASDTNSKVTQEIIFEQLKKTKPQLTDSEIERYRKMLD